MIALIGEWLRKIFVAHPVPEEWGELLGDIPYVPEDALR